VRSSPFDQCERSQRPLCKQEVAGSIPAGSIYLEVPGNEHVFSGNGMHAVTEGASNSSIHCLAGPDSEDRLTPLAWGPNALVSAQRRHLEVGEIVRSSPPGAEASVRGATPWFG